MGWFTKKDSDRKMSNRAYAKCVEDLYDLFRQCAEEAQGHFQKTYDKLKNGDKEAEYILAQLNLLTHEMSGLTVGTEVWQAVVSLHDSLGMASRYYLNYLYLNYLILHLKNQDKPRLTKEALSEIEQNACVLALSEKYAPAELMKEDMGKLYKLVFQLPENKYGLYNVSTDKMKATVPKLF